MATNDEDGGGGGGIVVILCIASEAQLEAAEQFVRRSREALSELLKRCWRDHTSLEDASGGFQLSLSDFKQQLSKESIHAEFRGTGTTLTPNPNP